MISVEKINETTFNVVVESTSRTEHTVTLDPGYYQKLTSSEVSEEKLIEKSFEFLLERESNRSILSEFNLKVINNYFPEYEKTIQKMLE